MEAERDGNVWTSVLAMKGKRGIPGGPLPTAARPVPGLKGAPWGTRLSAVWVSRFLQRFTPCFLVSVTCYLQAEKQNIKEEREKEAVASRQTRFRTFSAVVLFAHHQRAAWWGRPFFLWRENALWNTSAKQCLDSFMSHLRKRGCEDN